MTTFAEVVAGRTVDQVVAEILTDIDAYRAVLGLPPVTPYWAPTDLISEAIQGIARGIAGADRIVSKYATMASVQLATGELLKIRAAGFEQITIREAAPATGDVTVLNGSATAQTFSAGTDAFKSLSGVVYTATETKTIAAGASALIRVSGSVAGTSQDAAPATVTKLVSPRAGVSCTNVSGIVGVAAATDGEIRAAALLAPIARQPVATRARWEKAATDFSAHGVPVNRCSVRRIVNGVRVVLAKSTGALSLAEVATVAAYLEGFVQGDSGILEVVSATETTLGSGVITLWVSANDTRETDKLITDAAALVAGEIATIPIGGYSFQGIHKYPGDRITTVLGSLGIVDSDGVPGDLTLAPEAVAVGSGFAFVVRRTAS
jgi:hypothetical protein